ncbi:MAG: hypothetical protein A2804_01170 [Candidatus Pacebacteria bacterium RIFCSPHIGHO2_01_FULL_46_10]|nr:MAG: hypothetical protein A2804_01170 [Candidatus Pacebacteria bacterium RIFCSPHIGHO2_01_FULL_46_10]
MLIAQNSATSDIMSTVEKAIGLKEGLDTPGGILSALLPYLLTFGGIILFLMFIWGGFEMLTGAAEPKSQEAGKQRMTAAVIGFVLLFTSYWIAQLLQIVFGITILG